MRLMLCLCVLWRMIIRICTLEQTFCRENNATCDKMEFGCEPGRVIDINSLNFLTDPNCLQYRQNGWAEGWQTCCCEERTAVHDDYIKANTLKKTCDNTASCDVRTAVSMSEQTWKLTVMFECVAPATTTTTMTTMKRNTKSTQTMDEPDTSVVVPVVACIAGLFVICVAIVMLVMCRSRKSTVMQCLRKDDVRQADQRFGPQIPDDNHQYSEIKTDGYDQATSKYVPSTDTHYSTIDDVIHVTAAHPGSVNANRHSTSNNVPRYDSDRVRCEGIRQSDNYDHVSGFQNDDKGKIVVTDTYDHVKHAAFTSDGTYDHVGDLQSRVIDDVYGYDNSTVRVDYETKHLDEHNRGGNIAERREYDLIGTVRETDSSEMDTVDPL